MAWRGVVLAALLVACQRQSRQPASDGATPAPRVRLPSAFPTTWCRQARPKPRRDGQPAVDLDPTGWVAEDASRVHIPLRLHRPADWIVEPDPATRGLLLLQRPRPDQPGVFLGLHWYPPRPHGARPPTDGVAVTLAGRTARAECVVEGPSLGAPGALTQVVFTVDDPDGSITVVSYSLPYEAGPDTERLLEAVVETIVWTP